MEMLDHGMLNVPLAKRGDIDAQIDAYKRRQAAQAQVDREQAANLFAADKAHAKALLAQHEVAIVARHGARFGVKALRAQLDSWAKWEPRKLIAFVGKFVAEAA
jgi:hypothetical protein